MSDRIYSYGLVLFCFAAYVYYQRWIKQKRWNEIWFIVGKYFIITVIALILIWFLPHRSK